MITLDHEDVEEQLFRHGIDRIQKIKTAWKINNLATPNQTQLTEGFSENAT